MVTYENSLYCCMADHTGTLWETDNDLWQKILSLPGPPSLALPLYEKATLPLEENLGKLAILLEEQEPHLIFFNGKAWQHLLKGEAL